MSFSLNQCLDASIPSASPILRHVGVQQRSYLTLPSCPSQHNCTSLLLSYHLFAIPPHCHWNEQKVPRCSQTHLYPYHHTISSHPHKLNRPNKETLRKGPPSRTNKQALLTLQCNSLTDPKCATDRRRSSAGTKRWSKRFCDTPVRRRQRTRDMRHSGPLFVPRPGLLVPARFVR